MPDVLTLPLRSVVTTTPLTRLIRLDLGARPFVFQAGQAALIGTHGQTERRPYSIASSPDDAVRHRRIEFLVKVDAMGTVGPHLAVLTRGTRVDFEGPSGAFTLGGEPAPAYLFVAGGTGISPLRSMLRHLIASASGTTISVLYSARVPEELAFRAELERLARRHLIQLHLTVTGQSSAAWDGIRGRVAIETLERALPSKDAVCYLCGPPAMVEDVPPLLRQLGVPSSHVRTEEW
ncbi:MAG: FAD-binding oxidoreductase [Catenulispora sp.]